MDWDEARAYLQSAYGKLMAFLEAQSEGVLYGGPMQGAKNAWPLGRSGRCEPLSARFEIHPARLRDLS